MKILLMMLIIVLAIPLYATSVEGETATNSLRISLFSSKEELAIYDVSAQYREIIAIKPKEIVIPLPKEVAASLSDCIEMAIPAFKNLGKAMGGVRRIKSGRH